jgi:triosephosphate isomerase
MRKKLVAGNWKMNKTFTEAEDFTYQLSEIILKKDLKHIDIALCIPFVYLELLTDCAVDHPILTGAQNCSEHASGAYTGEISAAMLSSMDVDLCIVGHSERRQYFAETDELINKKTKLLLENEITPIVCVGENLEEREAGKTEQVVENQLQGIFHDLDFESDIIIAYEPVWAIGTGKNATSQQAQLTHEFIRSWITQKYSSEIAQKTRILYGGSMNPQNCRALLSQPDIDGGLIGGASLNLDQFCQIIDTAVKLS